jgi:hypothetical protein
VPVHDVQIEGSIAKLSGSESEETQIAPHIALAANTALACMKVCYKAVAPHEMSIATDWTASWPLCTYNKIPRVSTSTQSSGARVARKDLDLGMVTSSSK